MPDEAGLHDAIAEPPVSAQAIVPIDMLLWCPSCGTQHVDEPDERTPGWDNPPHKSHLCHKCRTIWRPADVPTNGVRAIATKGDGDNWNPARAAVPAAVLLDRLRSLGWLVSSHNDYVQTGKRCTFWMLTHQSGRWVRGTGPTDIEALEECRRQIDRYSLQGPIYPYAVDMNEGPAGNGRLTLVFSTHEQAQLFWRWAERLQGAAG